MGAVGDNRAHVIELLAQLLWGPKTADELRTAVGCSERCIGDWLRAMREGGVVRLAGKVRSTAPSGYRYLYVLQRQPFELPDSHDPIWPVRARSGA